MIFCNQRELAKSCLFLGSMFVKSAGIKLTSINLVWFNWSWILEFLWSSFSNCWKGYHVQSFHLSMHNSMTFYYYQNPTSLQQSQRYRRCWRPLVRYPVVSSLWWFQVGSYQLRHYHSDRFSTVVMTWSECMICGLFVVRSKTTPVHLKCYDPPIKNIPIPQSSAMSWNEVFYTPVGLVWVDWSITNLSKDPPPHQ